MQPDVPAVRLSDDLSLPAECAAWQRLTYFCAAVLALTGLFTCLCDTPMIWDGSYQFCLSLINQRPYFYLTRFHSYVLWLPMVWLSHFTENLTILKLAYGLPFALAPAFSLLASWWIVRDRAPRLIFWAIFGIAAAPLPGQIFIINDSIFQQHMFWPVFLGLLLPLRWPQIAFVSLVAVFQFSHQIGIVLLGIGLLSALLLVPRDRENQRELAIKVAILGLMAVIAAWKIVHFPDSYAQREFTRQRIHESWTYGVAGYPLRGVAFMLAAAAVVFVYRHFGSGSLRKIQSAVIWIACLCVFSAVVNWTIWALDSHKWSTAANYRRWVVPLTFPFYLLAVIDRWIGLSGRTPMPDESSQMRFSSLIGSSVALTFALVLSIQSLVWMSLTQRLIHDVEVYPRTIVPFSQIDWVREGPLYHWGTTSYIFVLEGRKPSKFVLDPDPKDARDQLKMLSSIPPQIPLSWFTPVSPLPGRQGWFDFRPMLYATHHDGSLALRAPDQ